MTSGDVVASVNDEVNTATNNKDNENDNDNKVHRSMVEQQKRGSSTWKRMVQWISSPILFGLLLVTGSAVRYPKSYITSIIILSIGLLIGGLRTNFYVESNESMLWKPIGSQPANDEVWINEHYFKNRGEHWYTNHKNNNNNNNNNTRDGDEEDVSAILTRMLSSSTQPSTQDNDIDVIVVDDVVEEEEEEDKNDIVGTSGSQTRFITVTVHAQGENVVTKEGMKRNFEMIDQVMNTPGYKEYCSKYGTRPICPPGLELACSLMGIEPSSDNDNDRSCGIAGITAFWFQNSTIFHNQVTTDDDVSERLSIPIWPGDDDDNLFNINQFVGFPRDGNDTLIVSTSRGQSTTTGSSSSTGGISTPVKIVSGVSYTTIIVIEKGGNSMELERLAVQELLKLRDEWIDDSNTHNYRLELFATSTFPDEFLRGIVKDLPLIPMVFLIMSIFTYFIFSKRGGGTTIESRGLLGFGAVIVVALSISSGYGLMFCCGVPFTVLTLIVPFVIFGVGLDDSYILMTAYDRTDRTKDPIERIHDTITNVGMSIFLTTSTSVVAFVLGISSTLPAIRWLCMYAAVTIWIDFIYQITFFLSMLVLDEQRLKANRRGCFVCWKKNTATATTVRKKRDDEVVIVFESPTVPTLSNSSDENDDKESPFTSGPACSDDQNHENPTPPGPASDEDNYYGEGPTPPIFASSEDRDEENPSPPGPGTSNDGSDYGDHENHAPPSCPGRSPPGPGPGSSDDHDYESPGLASTDDHDHQNLTSPGPACENEDHDNESPPPGAASNDDSNDNKNHTPPGPANDEDNHDGESPTPPVFAGSDDHDEENPPPPGPGTSNEGSDCGDHENHTPPCCSNPPGVGPGSSDDRDYESPGLASSNDHDHQNLTSPGPACENEDHDNESPPPGAASNDESKDHKNHTPPGPATSSDENDDDHDGENPTPPGPGGSSSSSSSDPPPVVKNFTEKFMTWYCEILFLPSVKPLVLAAFMALLVVCSINATKLRLEFDFTSLLPDDTYVKPFNKAQVQYATRPTLSPMVFFRDVDHSDPEIRAQMQDYVDALVELPHISGPPFRSWLREYNDYVKNNTNLVQGRSFDETISMCWEDPDYDCQKGNFMFDEQGNITSSKIDINVDALDFTSVESILSFVRGQKRIGSEQPINQKRKEWAFFNFDPMYFLWEFLYVTVPELVHTTYLGITTVAVMGLLFMPHWSGILFVFPLISILYTDLLGFLYMGGISINGVSYIALVMSIGLLVDFILHFIHQYYESEKIGRTEKAKDVLCTVGVAILQGGLSTFLGVLPLAFASNDVLHTIFVSFAGIVTLGVSHGLILLPVLMSYVGPE